MHTERMKGEFSWSTPMRNIDSSLGMLSRILRVPNLPDFHFRIHVIKASQKGIHVEVFKAPMKVLTSELSITLLDKHKVIAQLHHPWHEWGEKSCEFQVVDILEAPVITFECDISWLPQTNAPLVCSPSNLQDPYKPFLLQSSFSDVTILIGKEKLPAHKLILVAHSSVLKTMFESDMKEGRENKVVIKDIASDVMKNVLSFLYTGCDKPLNDSEMALKMLFVAEKYDMKNLKNRCESKLHNQLTISNVVKCLDAADLNNADNLKAECLKLMVHNKRAVLADPDFESLCERRPKLMYAFMKTALDC